ncbi:hypothetical protein JCM8547_007353 [Rhodosporidiobolus lusitaniae]
MGLWSFLSPSPAPDSFASTADKVDRKEGGGGCTDPDAGVDVEAQTALATWQALLEPFKGGALPEKARTNPSIAQKTAAPLTLLGLWQYVPFVARQSTSLTKAFVQHHLFGPPKPSWGVELTLFTTFLREVSSYSHLSSLTRLRSILTLGSLLPTPKDGIVTPISFRVKKRNLRGILAEFDAKEDGEREIHGEWVTNKRLWRKMTREWMTAEGGKAKVPPQPRADTGGGGKSKDGGGKDGLVCLYLHGGAYYMFSAETHRYLTISVSRYCEARVFAINYRLAPETRFPGQLHDAVSAYMRLIVDLKIPPENIIFAGDSAGGGLCLATLMYLRDEGYPLPAGGILMSPWCDLTMSCSSWETNRPYDYLPNPNSEDDHLHPVKCLLGDQIENYLTHPYVSPLFGDFTGLPPLLIQAGDAEVLRDEITLTSHKAAMAGVKVEHEVFEDCVHVFQAFLFLEASRKAFQSQRTYVKHTLPRLRRKLASSSTATSHAPSPAPSSDLSPDSEEFDFAEVDREVVTNGHKVDQMGNAEEESLPPTPQAAGRGKRDLPGEDIFGDEEDDEEDFDERLSDSTMSPADLSPAPEADTPTRSEFPSLSGPGSSPSSRDCGIPGQQQEQEQQPSLDPNAPTLPRRPILRAYSSARDLSMSNLASSTRSGSSQSPSSTHPPISSPLLARSLVVPSVPAAANGTAPSSRSRRAMTTSSPASPRFASRPLAPDQWPRGLHTRTTSHPEFDVLLQQYMEDQSGLRGTTKVWGPAAAGGAGKEVGEKVEGKQ